MSEETGPVFPSHSFHPTHCQKEDEYQENYRSEPPQASGNFLPTERSVATVLDYELPVETPSASSPQSPDVDALGHISSEATSLVTDRRMDGHVAVAKTALCIASRG